MGPTWTQDVSKPAPGALWDPSHSAKEPSRAAKRPPRAPKDRPGGDLDLPWGCLGVDFDPQRGQETYTNCSDSISDYTNPCIPQVKGRRVPTLALTISPTGRCVLAGARFCSKASSAPSACKTLAPFRALTRTWLSRIRSTSMKGKQPGRGDNKTCEIMLPAQLFSSGGSPTWRAGKEGEGCAARTA